MTYEAIPSFMKRDESPGPVKSWSYSAYDNHKKCHYWTFLSKIEKIPTEDSEAASRGEHMHKAIEDFILGQVDEFPDAGKHHREVIEKLRDQYNAGLVEVEGEWAYSLDFAGVTEWRGNDTWLRMKLDAIEFESSDMEAAEVIDWKSGQKYAIKHTLQGQLYAIGAFIRYPSLQNIKTTFRYLDKANMEPLSNVYTREQASIYLPDWIKRGRDITHRHYWPASPSKQNCRFCDYQKNNTCKYRIK